ncbi:MAG: MFS transporter, partial [Sciscionella sp.]
FSTGSIAAATIGFTMISMFLPLVIYIQSVLGFSPTKAGAVTAPMSLLSGLIAPFIGRLSDRISGKFIAMFGLFILAVGLGIIALQAEPDINAWSLVPALLVCGLGVGCVFSPLSNVTMNAVEPRLAGAASGVFNTSRQVGGVIGSAAVGVLLQATASHFIGNAAQDRAGALPERFRASFVDGMSNNSGASEFGGGAAGPTLPPGTPSSVAAKIGQVATDTFHAGFTDAVRVTLLLPIAVLLLGSLACTFMRRTAQRAPVPAAVGAASTTESAAAALAEEQPAERTVELPAVRTGERLVHGTVRLAGGHEIAGVALTLVDSTGRQIGRTSSGSDGSYTLDIGEAGNYVLIASAPAYSPVAEPISVNGQQAHLDLALSGAAGVEGTVRVGVHGDVLAEAVVTLVDGRGEIIASRYSDAEGRYALTGLAAGGYTMVVSGSGRAPVALSVQLAAGAGMLRQDVVLPDVGGVRGVARTARGARPVPEVMVTVVDAAGHVVSSTLTGESGEYTVDELPEGEYTVIASGYPPVASHVRLDGGDNPDHDIRLEHQLPASVG